MGKINLTVFKKKKVLFILKQIDSNIQARAELAVRVHVMIAGSASRGGHISFFVPM